MMSVYVADVGDGLAVGLRTLCGDTIQIDCGSQEHPERAWEKAIHRFRPEAFVLSHFHLDHYNGLLHAGPPDYHFYPGIRCAFFPRLPKFCDNVKFLRCMLAMAHWRMGDTTGSMEADFLGVLSRINHHSFTYRALRAGDRINLGGSQLDVLWPPSELDEASTLQVIARALSDFEAATAEDETLRRIYETIGEKGEVRPYAGEDGETGERPGHGDGLRERRESPYPMRERPLTEPIKKANESLRRAANHLSLALHEDNRLLFLGDLEAQEIATVVKALGAKQRELFLVMITPHHGTHWHKDLAELHARCAVSSAGERLFQHISPEFKSMADECFITHLNGDVEFPVCVPIGFGGRYGRYWWPFL